MTADIIQTQYNQLKNIAARFGQQAENNIDLTNRLHQNVDRLQQGGWEGQGSRAFFAEMDGEMFPTIQRLTGALEEARSVTLSIREILRQAEEEAANFFKSEAAVGGGTVTELDVGAIAGGTATQFQDSSASSKLPPPRIYIVNGINSEGNVFARDRNGNPIVGDDQSVAMEQMLERHGYDPDQVKSTTAIFRRPEGTNLTGTKLTGTDLGGWGSPIDWITGGLAKGVNAVTDVGANAINKITGAIADNDIYSSIYGSGEVLGEYYSGSRGKYTTQVYNEIAADLRDNPLLPGQKVILMGHSGGGSVVDDLPGMLERNLGVDVSGVVTMGSPVSNYDEAARYAEKIVDVMHSGDRIGAPLGTPIIRSEELRLGGPLIAPLVENLRGGMSSTPNVESVILTGDTDNAHGSYMHNPDVSVDMLRQLKRIFPEMSLQLPTP